MDLTVIQASTSSSIVLETHDVPVKPESRQTTDTWFLIVFVCCIILLMPFLTYTLIYSDTNLYKGYDYCGNICGQTNVKDHRWNCTGQDMTLKPKHIETSNTCDYIPSHPAYGTGFQPISAYISHIAFILIIASLIPLGLCITSVIFFRYATVLTVWIILILSWLYFPITAILSRKRLTVMIMFIIISMVLFCAMIYNVRRINQRIILLKQAMKALFDIKAVFYIPTMALCISLIILVAYTAMLFQIVSAAHLTEIKPGYLAYRRDGMMTATLILTTVMVIWIIRFVVGIHYMTVSDIVVHWYFARNNGCLYDNVSTSFYAILKNHLGTIALVSLVSGIVTIPQIIVEFLGQFTVMEGLVECCMEYINAFLSRNVYIITAMCGHPFLRSGKKGLNLLKVNIGNTTAVNSFGDFTITMSQVLIIVISLVCTYFISGDKYSYINYPLVVNAYFFFGLQIYWICTYVILGTIKVASATVFFCATEDFLQNREADTPFTMGKDVFLNASDKLFFQKLKNSYPTSV